jgi:hypothetical protein
MDDCMHFLELELSLPEDLGLTNIHTLSLSHTFSHTHTLSHTFSHSVYLTHSINGSIMISQIDSQSIDRSHG